MLLSRAPWMVPPPRVGTMFFWLRYVHVRHVRMWEKSWTPERSCFAFRRSEHLNNMPTVFPVTRKSKGNDAMTTQYMTFEKTWCFYNPVSNVVTSTQELAYRHFLRHLKVKACATDDDIDLCTDGTRSLIIKWNYQWRSMACYTQSVHQERYSVSQPSF